MSIDANNPLTAHVAPRMVRLLGLRRSGLHACAHALMGHFPGRVWLINDPDLTDRSLESRRFLYAVDHARLETDLSQQLVKEQAVLHLLRSTLRLPWPLGGLSRKWFAWCLRQALERTPVELPAFSPDQDRAPDTILVVWENVSAEHLARDLAAWEERTGIHAKLDANDGREIGLVLRSPWNCLASHLRRPILYPPHPLRPDQIAEAWNALAREALGETGVLAAAGYRPWVLHYDRYCTDREYRREIAARFGVEPTDIGLAEETGFGGGSSFCDNCGIDGSARVARWRRYSTHPLMRALFADPGLMELAARLNFSPPDTALR